MRDNCKTVSDSSGRITEDNKQTVEVSPSSKHQTDFIEMIDVLQNVLIELKIMNKHLSITTDEHLTEDDI